MRRDTLRQCAVGRSLHITTSWQQIRDTDQPNKMTLKFAFEVLGISSSGAKMSMLSRNKWCKPVNGFLVTASTAAAVNSLDLSSAEIADRERVAKEISLELWKPLSTRLGDLVPLEGLSFRDIWKPRGLWILKKTVHIFCNTIGFARFDGPLIFWFLVNLLAGGVFHAFKSGNVVIKEKYHREVFHWNTKICGIEGLS